MLSILLGYVIKLICTFTNEFREKMRGGGGQIMSCWATFRSIIGAFSPLKAHLCKPRGAQGHNGRQESKLQTPKKWPSCTGPSRGCPSRVIIPSCPGMKFNTTGHWKHLYRSPFGLWALLSRAGKYYGMREKQFWIIWDLLWEIQARNQRQDKGGAYVILPGTKVEK